MIDFLHPLALVLLPLPWIFWRFLPAARRRTGLIIPDRLAELLRVLRGPSGWPATAPMQMLAGLIGWVALVLALAAPLTGRTPLPDATGRDLMITLDLSISMLADDMELDGSMVSRITAVKALAGAFIRRRDGDRVGLIAFADQPFLIAPPTYDVAEVDAYLDEIDVGLPGRKTAVGDAIGMAVLQLRKQPASSRVILLLTDGSSNSGSIDPTEAARIANEHGIRIHTIGFGVPEGESGAKDEAQLASLASSTGGRYFPARSSSALQEVYRELDRIEPVTSHEAPRYAQRDWNRELLMLALAMLVASLLIEWQSRKTTITDSA